MTTRNTFYKRTDHVVAMALYGFVLAALSAISTLSVYQGHQAGEVTFVNFLEFGFLCATSLGILQGSRFCALALTIYVAVVSIFALIVAEIVTVLGLLIIVGINLVLMYDTFCIFTIHKRSVDK